MYHSVMANRNSSSRSPAAASSKAYKDLRVEVSSILVFALGVFALIALFSYSPQDPSFFTSTHEAVRNACGKAGAYIASLMLECFGIGAFLLPAALFFISTTIYKREGSVRLIGTLGGMLASVMSLTVFLAIQWKYWPFAGTLLLTGGAFGVWCSEILLHQFNPLGSSIVSMVVFCLALALSTPVSVTQFGAKVLGFFARVVIPAVYQAMKMVGAYLAYILGLMAMRAAHAAGDFLHRAIDAAIRKAKERAAAVKVEAAKAALAKTVSPVEEMPAVVTQMISAFDAPVDSVPNALPELEQNSQPELSTAAQIRQDLKAQEKIVNYPAVIPEILPPENQQELGLSGGASEAPKPKARQRSKRGQWKLPLIEFLRKPPKIESSIDKEKLLQNSQILRQKFADFGIDGEVTAVRPGPVITLYEFKPGPGIKVSKIAALADDLSMALSAQSVRILAPLPGKAVVGIEIPSDTRETVFLREFLQHSDFHGTKHAIPVVMGKDIGGQPYLSDMARMPHLLCAGQTGSGKSVFMNGLICSLLYRFTPDEMRMILVDPKFIEFRGYQDIPHLLLPVVDDPKHASTALKWAVREMDRRYRILAMMGARNLATFNQKVEEMGADKVRDFLSAEENQPEGLEKMSGGDWIAAFEPDEDGAPRVGKLPYIVIIIDELADLMMIAKKEVEISIARIAQKARAAGIHLVIATQRPSTDVITGLIKANLPSRASFQLASYIDSRTILDRPGAERLLGQGDMLFIPPGVSQVLRLHGAYVDDDEIGKITSFLKDQGKPAYRDEILVDDEEESTDAENGGDDSDELFHTAVELVQKNGHASASFLQRHLKVGYNRAARMIEDMESRGIVGPPDGARPREVLVMR